MAKQDPNPEVTATFAGSGEPQAVALQQAGESRPGGQTQSGVFSAGSMLAGRYRLVSRLGGGGMGDVYRADDLTLGQSVALKFLPEDAVNKPGWLDRFRGEVRLTRQISHPSVCRVYDIAEVDGRVFLSMEFIDGEDLSSLLRRIGRLPQDKAVQIARQICFGIAAAHEQGVIHRDLKPANIMLDGRGHARVMDFGIAGFAAELNAPGAFSAGTPAYMAPEQIEGREVTRRSDLYALGLVLYEIFTGKPAFQAASFAELKASRSQGTRPTAPSDIVADLDPAVELVILRCLEHDPALRPSSAVAVAAALPGGDPLAAALAAGQTPSPELVAASGEAGTIRPWIAIALASTAIALLLVVVGFRDHLSLLRYVPLENSPEVLASKARAAIRTLGYDDKPAATAYGFMVRGTLLAAIRREDDSPQRWEKLRDPALTPLAFWYRTSDFPLKPQTWYRVDTSVEDPPPSHPGDTTVILNVQGDLRHFARIEPVREQPSDAHAPAAEPSQGAPPAPEPPPRTESSQEFPPARGAKSVESLLAATMGLEPSSLSVRPPERLYTAPCDARAAFTAELPGGEPVPATIEVGLVRGRIMGVETVYPWSFQGAAGEATSRWLQVARFGQDFIQLGLLLGGAMLSYRNLKGNRADRRGAWRVGGLAFVLAYSSGILLANWSVEPLDSLFGVSLVRSIYFAFMWWMFYTALEPTLRKRSPHSIVSWSRFLDGRWNDPLVGRDVLVGVIGGLLILLLQEPTLHLWAVLSGAPPSEPLTTNVAALTSARLSSGQALDAVRTAIAGTLLTSLGIVILRGILRRTVAVAGALTVIFYVMSQVGPFAGQAGGLVLGALWTAVLVVMFSRQGVLSSAATIVVAFVLMRIPATLDFSRWYAFSGVPVVLAIVLVAILCAKSAIGRQAIFSRPLIDV